jgi:4-alpha-glucanotransferase
MDLPRSSGILLHPTSLVGGRLGDAARRFVDWLAAAGQAWWQMLPLGPPD